MNLHEYQGKEILNSFGVEIQRGIVATTPAEAVAAAPSIHRHRPGFSTGAIRGLYRLPFAGSAARTGSLA